jgi:hypothetical protein
MRELILLANEEFQRAVGCCAHAARYIEAAYRDFEQDFDLPPTAPAGLDLEALTMKLRLLESATESFCRDPVNVVLAEKGVMIQRFWNTLVDQCRRIYGDARLRAEHWLASVLAPMEARMKEAKQHVDKRIEGITKLQERAATLNGEIARQSREREGILAEFRLVASLMSQLDSCARGSAAVREDAPLDGDAVKARRQAAA